MQNHLIKAPFDPSPYADRVDKLLGKMTLAEKVGQLNLECLLLNLLSQRQKKLM